jgi:Zn-dependent protease
MDPAPPLRDYDPIQPRGTNWSGVLRRLFGPLLGGVFVLAKWGFVLLKFSTIFIAFGGYALIFGWKFAAGFVLLIFAHEMGHFIEAKREGLKPSWPIFVPFILAFVKYTRGNPWQTARVAVAGPILGGVASLGCYLVGRSNGSQLLLALAYAGFVLNLLNLVPIGFFDGGAIWRSARWLRLGGGGAKATVVYVLYAGAVLFCAIGAWAAYFPQHRL